MRSLTHRLRLVALALVAAAPAATQEPQAPPSATDAAAPLGDGDWFPQAVEIRDPPFNPEGTLARLDYVPGDGATRRWRLCAAVPGMELPYMQAVAHGFTAEAERQGVALRLEGSTDFDGDLQRDVLTACLDDGADALLVAAATRGTLAPVFFRARSDGVPVVDVATGSGSRNVTARVMPDATEVGRAAGSYLVERHPLGADTARVAWIPGPPDADFARAYDHGFRQAIELGAIELVETAFTELDESTLRATVRRILDDGDELDAFAGVGPAVLTARDVLADAEAPPALVATGIDPAIVAGIAADRIAAAVNDKPVIQGRIAVDLAIRALEGRPFLAEIRPTLEMIDSGTVTSFDRRTALVPED